MGRSPPALGRSNRGLRTPQLKRPRARTSVCWGLCVAFSLAWDFFRGVLTSTHKGCGSGWRAAVDPPARGRQDRARVPPTLPAPAPDAQHTRPPEGTEATSPPCPRTVAEEVKDSGCPETKGGRSAEGRHAALLTFFHLHKRPDNESAGCRRLDARPSPALQAPALPGPPRKGKLDCAALDGRGLGGLEESFVDSQPRTSLLQGGGTLKAAGCGASVRYEDTGACLESFRVAPLLDSV